MKLNKVIIENYRSIEKVEISFTPQCRVLVGKNEGGKSNVLKALSLLNPENNVEYSDLRESLPNEDFVREGVVRFVFSMEPQDINNIVVSIAAKILTDDTNNFILFQNNEKNITLEKFISTHFLIGISKIIIPSNKRIDTFWKINEPYKVPINLKKPIANSSFTFEFNGKTDSLSNFELIDINTSYKIPPEHYEDVTEKDILQILAKNFLDYLKVNKPDVVFWRYEDKYLLPPNIEINSFISNPDYCMPLKSMFELAGIEDVPGAIKEAQNKTKQGLRNLLERVANKTTEHFKHVWKEYKNIKFELSPNGAHIDASIKDTFNRYELSQRSDGFKRFVSFLLFISAKVESEIMKNTLLLFDEPDLALHPSGQKYLRDELIKISKNNYLIYSTHSIFMIDKEEISRHLIVEKNDEKTEVIEVNESNFVDEEVIFNALGFSIFETLKSSNIIFEGWKDKKMFYVALSRVPDKFKAIKKLKEVGLVHAKGVKDVKNIANILELAGRQYIVLSDNDKPAREKQLDFNKLRMNGEWKRYDELINGFMVTTVEDFIKPRSFVRVIDKLRTKYNYLPMIKEESFITSKTKLLFLDDELKVVESDKELRKNIIEDIKDMVFEELKPSEIEEEYYTLLERLVVLF